MVKDWGWQIGASFVDYTKSCFIFPLRAILLFIFPLGLPNQHRHPHTDTLTMAVPIFFSSNATKAIEKPPGESRGGLAQCRKIH